jgi:hypothetical protein
MPSFSSITCARSSAALLSLLVTACGQDAATPEPATARASIVVTDARIWTGDHAMPWAEALAADGETIVAVGSNTEGLGHLEGEQLQQLIELLTLARQQSP